MSHLPECPVPDMQVSRGALHPDDADANCICEELSACEQRVLNAACDAVIGCHLKLDSGEILRQGGDWENALDNALHALDALRGTP